MALISESPELGAVRQYWKYFGRIKIKGKVFRERLEKAMAQNQLAARAFPLML